MKQLLMRYWPEIVGVTAGIAIGAVLLWIAAEFVAALAAAL